MLLNLNFRFDTRWHCTTCTEYGWWLLNLSFLQIQEKSGTEASISSRVRTLISSDSTSTVVKRPMDVLTDFPSYYKSICVHIVRDFQFRDNTVLDYSFDLLFMSSTDDSSLFGTSASGESKNRPRAVQCSLSSIGSVNFAQIHIFLEPSLLSTHDSNFRIDPTGTDFFNEVSI